ncbi:hypothetical protein DFS33DRAFT_1380819 [Desarmillaria ectypa]|nr:hypothetical protein DFS33DRAFT_1380819 [Desarmillaria ectypa]
MLQLATPYARSCFSGSFEEGECTGVIDNYLDPARRSDHVSAYINTEWETCQATAEECALNWMSTVARDGECRQGAVPSYYIDVGDHTDVAAAFEFSRRTGVPVVIKNTGHDYMGRSSGPGTLGIWTHHLKQSKLTISGGSDATVGIGGGYLQGGGHRPLSNISGLAVDRVLEYEIVVPSGDLLVANEYQNPDLFFTLRGGGGGTFGVVMKVTTRALPGAELVTMSASFKPTTSIQKFLEFVIPYSVELLPSYINEPFKKSGDLLTGYTVALDPSYWEKLKAEQVEAAASEEVVDEVDQLDSENEEKPRKRKRDSEDGASDRKRKTSTTGDAKKEAPVKNKKGGKKKDNVESEDNGEAEEDVGTSKNGTSPPPVKKAKRGKDEHEKCDVAKDPEALKVREWRHGLQKTFSTNKGDPKEEDMPDMDVLFNTVEAYHHPLPHSKSFLPSLIFEGHLVVGSSILSLFSKIAKFMRHIAALAEEKIPNDNKYKFHGRAKALVDRWQQVLNANKNESTNGVTEGTAKMDLNGNGNASGEDKKKVSGAASAVPHTEEPLSALPGAYGAGDVSMLGDVTMSEAAA